MFSFLTSLSQCDLVNQSTLTFGNINLTEVTNLILLLLGYSIKTGCKNLYLHSEPFKITFKSSSHLTSISWCCLVTPSTHNFPNINLTKTMTNLLTSWLYHENILVINLTKKILAILKSLPSCMCAFFTALINGASKLRKHYHTNVIHFLWWQICQWTSQKVANPPSPVVNLASLVANLPR